MSRFFILFAAALLFCAETAFSEGPKPFPEFKAKRVQPPKSGSGRLITIQIDPAVSTAPRAETEKKDATTEKPVVGRYAWFWDSVSPDRAQSGPGRLEQAFAAMNKAPQGVSAPRLQDMQDIAKAVGKDILRTTVGTEVSPALVLAVIAIESAGQTSAVSSAGAQGLMQLMPDTAARFGVSDSLVPADNIRGGVAYLDWLMEEFDSDPILVLAGYNAGEGSVRKYEGVPPFAETRDYVPKVLAAFQVAVGMCRTRPELISDGCVFAALN